MNLVSTIRTSLLVFSTACSLGVCAFADTLDLVGKFEWPSDSFIGLSGLEVSEDGRIFYAVGDRGWFLSGEFERTGDKISDLKLAQFLPILGNDGLPVAARRLGDWSDAEGLAIAPDGEMWISFERWAHVSKFDGPEMTGQWIKDHPSFSELGDNRQLEALAIHPDGSLFTFSERPLRDGFPVYRLADDGWTIDGYIQEENGFSIVGADFDNSGTLYILERKLVLGLWWQNRIRRLEIDDLAAAEILWTGGRGEYHNLEGIAVWQDDGGLRITMVSDNNGNENETTQFVEFRLTE